MEGSKHLIKNNFILVCQILQSSSVMIVCSSSVMKITIKHTRWW